MLDRSLTLYSFTLTYCGLLTKDLDDAQLAVQPAPGMNHPAWILGHLALCTDYAAQLLGEPMVCPKKWHVLFGPGSKLSTERSDYPNLDVLLTALTAGHQRVSAAAARASAETLSAPQASVFPELLPTVGDLLAHLMTTHESLHLGQLSAWRRCVGLPSVLGL